MFVEGELLYFNPFIFPDGGKPKPKYFVVLKNLGDGLLIASLLTSKDHVPADIPLRSGCMEFPERMVNVYVFMEGDSITPRFCFPLNTFIYGASIKRYPISVFEEQLEDGEISIESKGVLHPELYADLIACLMNSSSVKRKYKHQL